MAIKSTEDFIHKIKQMQLPGNYIMASLDIVSLYPSIDTQENYNKIFDGIEQIEDLEDDMKLTIKESLV